MNRKNDWFTQIVSGIVTSNQSIFCLAIPFPNLHLAGKLLLMTLLTTDTWRAELIRLDFRRSLESDLCSLSRKTSREDTGLLSRTAAGNQASVELRAHKWKRSLFSPLCYVQREGVFAYNDKNLSSETGSRTTERKVYFRNKHHKYSSRLYLYHLNYIKVNC